MTEERRLPRWDLQPSDEITYTDAEGNLRWPSAPSYLAPSDAVAEQVRQHGSYVQGDSLSEPSSAPAEAPAQEQGEGAASEATERERAADTEVRVQAPEGVRVVAEQSTPPSATAANTTADPPPPPPETEVGPGEDTEAPDDGS